MANRRYTLWLQDEDIVFLQQAYPRGHSKVVRLLIQRHRAKVDQRTKELLKNVAGSDNAAIDLEQLGVTDDSIGADTGDLA
jgi:hypothetical protein